MAGSRVRGRSLRRPAILMAACAAVTLAACSKSGDSGGTTTAPPRSSAAITITEAENGKTIAATIGDTVELRLAANPSTGYSWKVTKQPDGSVLKLSGTTHEAADTEAVGAGGTDVWTFDAIGEGSTDLKLEYIGPGTDAEVGEKFSATVTVGTPS